MLSATHGPLGALNDLRRRPAATRRRALRLDPVQALEDRTLLAMYLVNTVADSGAGSLRQAITDANTNADPAGGTIQFQFTGTGPFVIQPLSALPPITAPLLSIDGYTQSGSSVNTTSGASNAKILIQLDGTLAGGVAGLEFNGEGDQARGLAIGHFLTGIAVNGGANANIAGNDVGTDASGLVAAPNSGVGISVNAPGVIIGGLSPINRNVISGNGWAGIALFGSETAGDLIQGNLIGLDANGARALPNSPDAEFDQITYPAGGIYLGDFVTGVTIGDPSGDISGRNVISGNGGDGIQIGKFSVSNIHINGNYIGVDVTGQIGVGNRFAGVEVQGDNIAIGLGGTATATYPNGGNVISGNGADGIQVDDRFANHVSIQGNFIGTNFLGDTAIGNGGEGIDGGYQIGPLQIGGIHATDRNLISGNLAGGISVQSPQVVIQGNSIGTDANGFSALGNGVGFDGLRVENSSDLVTTIGGTLPGAGNLISGNSRDGLVLNGQNLVVQGNLIGTNRFGDGALPNGRNGILAADIATAIGGLDAGAGNTIAFNAGDGIDAPGNASVAILGNSLFANAGLGIDRGPGGPNIVNPVLTRVMETSVAGTLDEALPSTIYRVELFANPTNSPDGHGQGRTFLGGVTVTTDANGFASFVFTASTNLAGQSISATATYSTVGATSQFAANVVGTSATGISVTASPMLSTYGQAITLSADVTSAAAGTPTGTVVFVINQGIYLFGTLEVVNGVARATVSLASMRPLAALNYFVFATYNGDANFAASESPVPAELEVDPAATTTQVVQAAGTTPGRVAFGQTVTFVASVTLGAPTYPTEDVTFLVDGVPTAAEPLFYYLGSDLAIFATNTLAMGSHLVTALYHGDRNNRPSLSPTPISIVVGLPPSAFTRFTATPNPPALGQAIIFNVALAETPEGTPPTTGTVTFFDGSVAIGSVAVGGSSPLAFTTTLSAGPHQIVASYDGGGTSLPATSTLDVTVSPGQTVTTLTASGNPVGPGRPVTFTATVHVEGSPETPTGSVTFRDGSTVLGVVAVDQGGLAILTTSALGSGSHSVIAEFVGGLGFANSTSAPVNRVIPASVSPTVIGLARIDTRSQPTPLVLTFSGPLNVDRAQDLRNYLLFGPGAFLAAPMRQLGITRASYDVNAHTVTLTLARGLVLRPRAQYRLSANGTPVIGLTGAEGEYLAGAGHPGSTFVTTFRGGDLPRMTPVKPVVARIAPRSRRPR